MMPAVYVGFIALGINIGLNALLINGVGSWPGLGFIGSAITSSITYILHPIMLWLYVLWTGAHKATCLGCEVEFAHSFSPLFADLLLASGPLARREYLNT